MAFHLHSATGSLALPRRRISAATGADTRTTAGPEVNHHVRILRGRAHLGVPALLEPGRRRVLVRKAVVLEYRISSIRSMCSGVRYPPHSVYARSNFNKPLTASPLCITQ